jgi:periplasmic divalent cation tolerance protein
MGGLSEARSMQDRKEYDILIVTTTVNSREQALALANEILAQRLAACVQVDEIAASLYRWEGAVREEAELRLSIKTIAGAQAALQALFEQHHPYDLPQFIAVRADASAAYAGWVRREVGPAS